MLRCIRRVLEHFEKKSWLDKGFRTFEPQTYRTFKFLWETGDYQGDKRYSVTLHLFGRAIQYTIWTNGSEASWFRKK